MSRILASFPRLAADRVKSPCGQYQALLSSSPHWRRWLGVESRCVVPFTSFAENEILPDDSRPPVWFALDESRGALRDTSSPSRRILPAARPRLEAQPRIDCLP